MCLHRWEKYSWCGHQEKRFDSFCSKAVAAGGTRCGGRIEYPKQLYKTSDPGWCPNCYGYAVKMIRKRHAKEFSRLDKIISKNLDIRSSKHGSKTHVAAQRAINLAFKDLEKAKANGRKELADFWNTVWGWVWIDVPLGESPPPHDMVEGSKLFAHQYRSWFEPGESNLGEYLTQQGRGVRAMRLVEGLSSVTTREGCLITPDEGLEHQPPSAINGLGSPLMPSNVIENHRSKAEIGLPGSYDEVTEPSPWADPGEPDAPVSYRHR